MVGANYMGGKRNTVRAKSKDAIGRVQRRHFGKQRLASALCIARETRVSPGVLPPSSVLPEITLAHAHSGVSTGSSAGSVFIGDRSYLANDSVRRERPSKVLGVLDTFDHVSTRAAVDRILQQPDLVGINIPKPGEAACIKHTKTPEGPTKHSSGRQAIERESKGLPEYRPNPRSQPANTSIPSLPHSPLELRGARLCTFDGLGYAKAQSFGRADLYAGSGHGERERPSALTDGVDLLPRSSPFSSSLRSSDSLVLDLDPSPWVFGRPDRVSREDHTDASSSGSIRQPSRRFPIPGAVRVEETGPSFATSEEEEFGFERSCATRRDDCTPPPADLRSSDSREQAPDFSGVLTGRDVAGDGVESAIAIDLLSDPRPWEAIDRILQLKPQPSTAHWVKIDFTKDREGVGHDSGERSSDMASAPETRTGGGPADDIHGACRTDPGGRTDERMAVNAGDLRCPDDRTAMLLDAGPGVSVWTEMEIDGPCLFGDSDLEEESEE